MARYSRIAKTTASQGHMCLSESESHWRIKALTLVTIAVSAAGYDDSVHQQVLAQETDQLVRYRFLLFFLLGGFLHAGEKRWFFFFPDFITFPATDVNGDKAAASA